MSTGSTWPQRFIVLLCVAFLAGACGRLPDTAFVRESEQVRRLTVLYTNDEHGWMEATDEAGGAAGMLERWRSDHGYADDEHFLVLSGGDMWTGPAVSTLLEGRSMIDVMNRMGYAAAAVGNHDFDFGQDALRERAEQADFPFLSANLIDRQTVHPPDYVQAFTVREVNGVRVAIVGLTTVETSVDTRPSYVQGLRFRRYENTLLEVLPTVQQEEPDVILVIAHMCNQELQGVADVAQQYGIPLLGGGHCHEEHNDPAGGTRLIESGFFLRGYVKVDMFVDIETDDVVAMDTQIWANSVGPRAPALQTRIEYWRDQLQPAVREPIGYTAGRIDRRSQLMDRLLTEAWLGAVPEARVALASRRYVQASIPPGEITPGTIVGVLPVQNELFRIQLTGEQLRTTINSRDPLLGGLIRTEDGLRFPGGEALDPDATYEVVLPDVIYFGANYYEVQALDPSPTGTDLNWRDPVVEFIRDLESSRERPLDQLLGSE